MFCVTHGRGFARKVANLGIFMDGGEIIEENEPAKFFNNPQSSRTKLFLSQILHHYILRPRSERVAAFTPLSRPLGLSSRPSERRLTHIVIPAKRPQGARAGNHGWARHQVAQWAPDRARSRSLVRGDS